MDAFRDMVRGWLGKTLLVLLIVPFAIVGIESYFAGGGDVLAAKVNGTKIMQPQVDDMVERERQQMLAQMGANADPAAIDVSKLRQGVLDGLISRELLAQQARKDGYLVSDATVYKLIREVPAFQENGQFSQSRYEQLLRQIGESPASYPARAKQEMAYSLMVSGLGQSGFVTGPELNRLAMLDSQKRDIHIAVLPAARYLATSQVGEADIKQFYSQHPERFTAPETVTLQYIRLKQADFLAAASPSEDDLKALYEEKLKAVAGNEQRQAQHILITVDDKVKDADALKKIQAVEKRARAGEDFAKLAKEFSQDPGSVANGGDLGLVGRGQFVPEFDKVLFAMKAGEISAPVKTQYGYHLIKLNKIEVANAPSYAALKPELEKEAKAARADELFADQVDKLDAAVYEASDLKEPAENFKLALQQTAAFTRQALPADFGNERKVAEAAFSDDLLKDGKNSQGIHLADGSVVWLHVVAHQAAELKPLAAVSVEVRNQLLLEKAKQAAAQAAASAVKALREGRSLAEVATSQQLSWQNMPASSRRTPLPSPEMLRLAYRLPRPAAGKVSADSLELGASYAVVAVSRVEEGQAGAEVAQMRSVLAENRSQQELQDYVRSLRERGDVEVTPRKDDKAED